MCSGLSWRITCLIFVSLWILSINRSCLFGSLFGPCNRLIQPLDSTFSESKGGLRLRNTFRPFLFFVGGVLCEEEMDWKLELIQGELRPDAASTEKSSSISLLAARLRVGDWVLMSGLSSNYVMLETPTDDSTPVFSSWDGFEVR